MLAKVTKIGLLIMLDGSKCIFLTYVWNETYYVAVPYLFCKFELFDKNSLKEKEKIYFNNKNQHENLKNLLLSNFCILYFLLKLILTCNFCSYFWFLRNITNIFRTSFDLRFVQFNINVELYHHAFNMMVTHSALEKN